MPHQDRYRIRIDNGEVDAEGHGGAPGLSDLALRLQSAQTGDSRNLVLRVNGLHGTEKFDLRLAVGTLRLAPQGVSADGINLVAQLTYGDDNSDVAGGWIDLPPDRLEVNLLETGQGEVLSTWNGATHFEAASARPAEMHISTPR